MDTAIAVPGILHEVEMLNDVVDSIQTLGAQLVELVFAQIDVRDIRHLRKRRCLLEP